MPAFARNIKKGITDCLRPLVFSVLFIVFCYCCRADDFTASINVAKANCLIGDKAAIELNISAADGVAYSLPDLRSYLSGVSNLKFSRHDSVSGKSATVSIYYSFTSFEPAKIIIPEISIAYEKPGYSSAFIYKCAGKTITFTAVPVDTSKGMRGIHGEIPIGYNSRLFSFWYILFGSAIIIFLIVCWIYNIFRKKQKNMCPRKELIKKLEKLRKQQLPPGELAVKTAELAKQFIFHFYFIKAFELSSDEIRTALKKNVNDTQLQRLDVVFVLADRVKFGKYQANEHEAATSLEMCAQFAHAILRENADA